VGQGVILILGGLIGCLATWANVSEHYYGLAAINAVLTLATFSLAWWLIKKGKKEVDGPQ
jgi:hypothetical protein